MHESASKQHNNRTENTTVVHTVQINFQAVDVNKYRYIQAPIGLLIFEVIDHVYMFTEVLTKEHNKSCWT